MVFSMSIRFRTGRAQVIHNEQALIKVDEAANLRQHRYKRSSENRREKSITAISSMQTKHPLKRAKVGAPPD